MDQYIKNTEGEIVKIIPEKTEVIPATEVVVDVQTLLDTLTESEKRKEDFMRRQTDDLLEFNRNIDAEIAPIKAQLKEIYKQLPADISQESVETFNLK